MVERRRKRSEWETWRKKTEEEGRKEGKLKVVEGEKAIRKTGERKMRQKIKPSTTCIFEVQSALIQLSMQCVQIDSWAAVHCIWYCVCRLGADGTIRYRHHLLTRHDSSSYYVCASRVIAFIDRSRAVNGSAYLTRRRVACTSVSCAFDSRQL